VSSWPFSWLVLVPIVAAIPNVSSHIGFLSQKTEILIFTCLTPVSANEPGSELRLGEGKHYLLTPHTPAVPFQQTVKFCWFPGLAIS
jgi:hypothetical protein